MPIFHPLRLAAMGRGETHKLGSARGHMMIKFMKHSRMSEIRVRPERLLRPAQVHVARLAGELGRLVEPLKDVRRPRALSDARLVDDEDDIGPLGPRDLRLPVARFQR